MLEIKLRLELAMVPSLEEILVEVDESVGGVTILSTLTKGVKMMIVDFAVLEAVLTSVVCSKGISVRISGTVEEVVVVSTVGDRATDSTLGWNKVSVFVVAESVEAMTVVLVGSRRGAFEDDIVLDVERMDTDSVDGGVVRDPLVATKPVLVVERMVDVVIEEMVRIVTVVVDVKILDVTGDDIETMSVVLAVVIVMSVVVEVWLVIRDNGSIVETLKASNVVETVGVRIGNATIEEVVIVVAGVRE